MSASRADLIVLGADRIDVAGSVRMGGDGRAYAAIVMAAGGTSAGDPAIDDVLRADATHEDIVALATRWTPLETPALDRLSTAFGVAEVVRLAAGLRDQLEAAIPALAHDAEIEAAHRLAGLSGMLGFAALGQQWSALSDGEGAEDRRALRIATRQAIVALDRFVTDAACPACAPASGDGGPGDAPPPRC